MIYPTARAITRLKNVLPSLKQQLPSKRFKFFSSENFVKVTDLSLLYPINMAPYLLTEIYSSSNVLKQNSISSLTTLINLYYGIWS